MTRASFASLRTGGILAPPLVGTYRGTADGQQLVEVDAFTAGRVKVRQLVRWRGVDWRIVGVARIPASVEGAVVVRLEPAAGEVTA